MHELCLLSGGVPLGDRAQHRAPEPQRVDLGVQRADVGSGDLRQRQPVVQDGPDSGQRQTEIAQGADQVEPGDRVDVVAPVAGDATAGGGHDPLVGVEPDRAHRQAGALSQLPDRVQAVVAHNDEGAVSTHWRHKTAWAGRTARLLCWTVLVGTTTRNAPLPEGEPQR